MGKELKFITKLHKSSSRDYVQRMINEKPQCMSIAKNYAYDYWDGDRKYGYGGYKYIKNHFKEMAINIIREYQLSENSKVLDVGCGKGYLIYEIKKILPNIKIQGLDISEYAINNCKEEIADSLYIHDISRKTNYLNKELDLVLTFGCLHNLEIKNLFSAIKEINRISKRSFIMVESYRNDKELFNLQCWALTCNSFFSKNEWIWIYNELKFKGDYEFIYFE